MRPGPRNLITDVAGLRVGNAADPRARSGVTVLTADAPFVAGVHIMGGAPGTRETELLAPDRSVGAVDALVLSGGSAFGLGAAEGVMSALRGVGRGYSIGPHRVPIVPAAILFDLSGGGDTDWDTSPYPALGRAAWEAAAGDFLLGTAGAGTGATTAGLKGGLGSASAVLPSGITVGALVAVNALGSVIVGDGPQFWAAPWEEGKEFGGRGMAQAAPRGMPVTKLGTGPAAGPAAGPAQEGNTTIAIVATDAALTKAGAQRMATAAHDGIARAIVPSHTPMDGDLVFAVSTGARARHPGSEWELGHAAATTLARAIARAVFAASATPGDPHPAWSARFG